MKFSYAQTYVRAVNSGEQDLQSVLALASTQHHQQQQIAVPSNRTRILHQSTKAHKTVDTEDTELKCLAQPDGTIITEKKKTTEHEELFDEDLPEKDDDNSTGSCERVDQKVCTFYDFTSKRSLKEK